MADGPPAPPPTPSHKLEGIEAARGVAALMVVLRHATTILAEPAGYGLAAFGGLFAFGRAGVEFFFVLSGFIIAYVHAADIGRPAAFGSFWRKRLLRIYPPYWVATAVLGALLVLSPTKDLAERDPVHVLLSLLLLPESQDPVLGVGWSLRHEMLFYLLFSVAVLHRGAGAVLLAGWAVAVVLAVGWAEWTGFPVGGGVGIGGALGGVALRIFNLHFFFGMAVAWLVLHRPAWRPRMMLLAGAVLFLGNGLVEDFRAGIQPEQPALTLVYGLSAAAMLYGLAVLDRGRALVVPRAMVALGGASYSLYLLHVTVILVVAFALRRFRDVLPLSVAFAICVVAAVVAGVVFSLVVERPLLRWGRGFGRHTGTRPDPGRAINP